MEWIKWKKEENIEVQRQRRGIGRLKKMINWRKNLEESGRWMSLETFGTWEVFAESSENQTALDWERCRIKGSHSGEFWQWKEGRSRWLKSNARFSQSAFQWKVSLHIGGRLQRSYFAFTVVINSDPKQHGELRVYLGYRLQFIMEENRQELSAGAGNNVDECCMLAYTPDLIV